MPESGAGPHIERLSRLSDLMACLSRTRFIGDALRVVCSHTKHITGVDRVTIALLRSRGTCELYALDGAEGELPLGSALPTADTLIGAAVKRGAPVTVTDLDATGWLDVEMLRDMGMRAAMDVPLIASDSILGTLNTAASDPDVYDAENSAMLVQIAAMLAVTLRALQTLDSFPVRAAFSGPIATSRPQDDSPVDMQPCLDTALERARASEFSTGIEFTGRVERTVPDAVVDLSALERALDDVAARAIAFTRSKAITLVISNHEHDAEHILVSAEAADTTVSISVKIGSGATLRRAA
jgi:signal transduction protein with GAF and PtsI domain